MMHQIWEELIDMRMKEWGKEFSLTQEYQLRQSVKGQLDNMAECNLTVDQRDMVEEILSAYSAMARQDGQRLYRQGMKDAAWVMKEMGVLG